MPLPVSPSSRLGSLPIPLQWLALGATSAAVGWGLHTTGLPAALLLGPMIAAICCALAGTRIHLPRAPYLGAQAMIGCMIGGSISPGLIASFLDDWALFLAIVLATVAASSLLGWMMSRWGSLPGTTSVWGSSPGAASAMVVMAEAFGADVRLVAFMQYLRVVCVASAAALIAHLWVEGAPPPPIPWFPALDGLVFGQTLALTGIGAALGVFLRVPSGAMVVPMVAAAVFSSFGLLAIHLPPWLLALAYAALGWTIGLGFTRAVLAHAARALPQILASIAALMAFCGGTAWLLTRLLGVDPVTAYLATSPGGLDSVAIIAASSARVDLSFVMALQTARFVVVICLGPPLARFIAGRIGGKPVA
ncbi:ammonia monooxygenase [Rhodospirillum rubrum]|uniref:AbrB family transcriptional regulator n=1 Tax=Rhodospirillum rubrum TaxID=1085 RepID=UPI00190381DC|nr:AbrB family transcriptional regulator [Rhodospirillum rubrum]MBK1664513.1 ammonia monooxygenase [Rhodospirillum rubrum]MBK1676232.1 ammonia monooxygenase [Rhodospirillum rubrum]